MSRIKLEAGERKDERICALLTTSEFERINRYCRVKKTNRSDFLRAIVMGKVEAHEKRNKKTADDT